MHIIDMKKAYRFFNPKHEFCEVKCGEKHDRVSHIFIQSVEQGWPSFILQWNGSFHQQYIDVTEPRQPTELVQVEFAKRQSLCYRNKPDLVSSSSLYQ